MTDKAETRAALEKAIQDHFGELTEGAITTGYVLQIIGNTIEDLDQRRFRHVRMVMPGQNAITTIGIVDWLHATAHTDLINSRDV